MPLRRLFLFVILIGLLTATLFSRYGAHAQNLSPNNPTIDDGTEQIGEWLRLVKESVPDDPTYVIRGETAHFTIAVHNTSNNFAMQNVTVTDQLTPDCNLEIGGLAPGGKASYSCRHESVQEPFTNKAVVTGKNATNGKTDSASDTARVEVLELSAAIEPETNTIPSPGGSLQFTVNLTNLSSVQLELDSLISPQLGNLTDPQNGNVSNNSCTGVVGRQLSANGGSYECKFKTNVTGPPGDYTFSIDATGSVDDVETVTGSDAAVVKIFETIAASLAAEQEKVVTGSTIKLTATIRNLSKSTTVNILAMEDAVLGDVRPHGNCSLPKTLAPGGDYTCYYQQTITAAVGEEQTFILNVSAETDDKPPISLVDQAAETVLVIEPLVFLPITPLIPRPTSCESVLNINTNFNYKFYPDTTRAYYRFVLTEAKDVTVELKKFKSSDGQVTLYKYTGDECDVETTEVIYYDGTDNEDRTLPGGIQQPGTYYVFVFNGGNLSTKEAYSLIIKTQ